MILTEETLFNINDTHKFEIEGTKILMDINSGSVHLIDQVLWDIHDRMQLYRGDLAKALVSLREQYPAEILAEGEKEIRELAAKGQLFTQDDYALTYRVPERPVLKSLCLNIAHDCNLRCDYCFASEGHFGGQSMLMPEEVGIKAIDFLMERSGARKHCEVDFFGGEPLMNINVVKAVVAYGREQEKKYNKEIKFTLTTNGVALHKENEDFLNREGISVVLSLDGRPEVHDRVRKFPAGKGSYEAVSKNIKRFVESRQKENYYLRGTFTGFNKDFFQDARHLVNEGYDILSLEPVVASPEEPYALKDEDLPGLREEYLALAKLYRERKKAGQPFTFFHFNLDLNHGPCLPKRLIGCGAGHEYMVITPEGDIYPCHQFVGRENYKLGNLASVELNESMRKSFQNAHIYHKDLCRTCWARFHCSGGCHANAEAFNQDIYQPYELGCKLQKMRLEFAVWLQVLDLLEQ